MNEDNVQHFYYNLCIVNSKIWLFYRFIFDSIVIFIPQYSNADKDSMFEIYKDCDNSVSHIQQSIFDFRGIQNFQRII